MDGMPRHSVLCVALALLFFADVMSAQGQKGLPLSSRLQQYIIRQWTREHGLPENNTSSLCQTRDGYLWIGTGTSGLVRFDGQRFRVFSSRNSPLPDARITFLHEDAAGKLWIGTFNGLIIYDHGRWSVLTKADGLPHNVVYNVLFDHDGGLWIATWGGLWYRRGTTTKIFTKENGSGLASNNIRALTLDSAKTVWVGTYGGGMYRIEQGRCVAVQAATGAPIASVFTMLTHPNGTVWIGSEQGLYYKESGSNTHVHMLFSHRQLGAVNVKRMTVAPDGALWFGTVGGGLYRKHGEELQRLTKEEGLTDNGIEGLAFDHEGSLWVATDAGINQVRCRSISPLLIAGKPLSIAVTAAILDKQNMLWLGTNEGLYVLRDSGGIGQQHHDYTLYTTNNGLQSKIIASLHEDRNGRIWIGTNTGGLHLRVGNQFRHFTTKHGLAGNVIRSITEDKQGNIWVSTDAGISKLAELAGDFTITSFNNKTGLQSGIVGAVGYHVQTNTLWVGYIIGEQPVVEVLRTDGSVYKRINLYSMGVQVNQICTLTDDGNVWIATSKGLYTYIIERDTLLAVQQNLPMTFVCGVVQDINDRLWIATGQGLVYTTMEHVRRNNAPAQHTENTMPPSYRLLTVHDGLPDQQCSAGTSPVLTRTSDGRLFVTTVRGLGILNASQLLYNTVKPNVWIEALRADDVVMVDNADTTQASEIRLEYTIKKIELDYTALSLQVPEAVQFEYMLEGYDKSWTQAGTRRTAYYTNLPYGYRYRFRVRACTNHGVWNEARSPLHFSIRAPWWDSWWAYCIYAVLVATMGYGALKSRDRFQRKKILEQQREREAAIIRRKNDELAAANEELQALNDDKNELMGIVAHDLKNPLGIIMLTAESLKISSFNREMVVEYSDAIFRSAERMLELIRNLLDVNAIEQGGIHLFLTELDVGLMVQTVIDSYLTAAQAKNISLHYNCVSDVIAFGDEQAVMQVLDNLVSNAVKYSPQGKRVAVRVQSSEGVVRVEVQDEGPGLSDEDKKKLFGKFARLSARPTGGEHSTGLGLSIVKRLVEAMHGRVWCESELGKGATFIVELPAVIAQQGDTTPAAG